MGVASDRRRKFLVTLLGTGVAAVSREIELRAACAPLTVSEEDQVRAAGRAIAFVHAVVAEFLRNGVPRWDDDLTGLSWWPDAGRASEIVLRLMSYSAAGEFAVERIDPDAFDLPAMDLAAFNLRALQPSDFFT